MKKFCKSFGIIALTLFFLCSLARCGGGGNDASTSRGGGADALLTAANAQVVGDTVVQALRLVAPTTALGDLKTSGVSSSGKPPLAGILEKILSAPGSDGITLHSRALYTISDDCTTGDITINIESVDLFNKVINADIDVNSCTTGTEILNGRMNVEYVLKSIADPTNLTLDSLKNFEKVTITTSHFTYINSANDDNIALSDLTLVLEDFTYSGNTLTGGSVRLGGSVTGVLSGEAIDVVCDSFRLVFSSDGAGGTTVSASGRINASCLGGWVRIFTNSAVFLPPGADCPTSGDIFASAGGNSVRVFVAADFRITIYFNDDPVQTFDSCNDVKGLCTG